MLRFLVVRNLSVIDHVEVEFEPGLNVLTGETGAGKSVLVEAIGLLVGGRASADEIRTGESQASVQAIFEIPGGREVIVRREISAQGRSRAFIDDALATSGALREFGASVLELHGQHEHQLLLEPSEHLGLLDSFAAHDELVERVAAAHAAWRLAAAALQRTVLGDREKRERVEAVSFELQEIERVAPQQEEDERLAAEKSVLANADRIHRLASEAYAALYEGEGAALTGLAVVFKRLGDLQVLDSRFTPFAADREDLKARLEDLALFLRRYVADLDNSPERLQAVEDRLAALERLKRRHGPSLEDVIAKAAALRDELEALGASEEQAAALEEKSRRLRDAFLRDARELAGARRAAADRLAARLQRDLRELAMPACRVEVHVEDVADEAQWTRSGVDRVEIYISPNPGEDLRPLARIASGGELSRIMLALRAASYDRAHTRTLIFDEVDAGIGGAAADAVGRRLQTLGDHQQVLCVTHLAQIAARARTHLCVSKHVRSGRTVTTLNRLDGEDREAEIGRMIAGAAVSPQVLLSAREMLRDRQASEQSTKGESETRQRAKAKGQSRGR